MKTDWCVGGVLVYETVADEYAGYVPAERIGVKAMDGVEKVLVHHTVVRMVELCVGVCKVAQIPDHISNILSDLPCTSHVQAYKSVHAHFLY